MLFYEQPFEASHLSIEFRVIRLTSFAKKNLEYAGGLCIFVLRNNFGQ
jgi:hypothetical protein